VWDFLVLSEIVGSHISVFRAVTSCSLVSRYQRFVRILCPEDSPTGMMSMHVTVHYHRPAGHYLRPWGVPRLITVMEDIRTHAPHAHAHTRVILMISVGNLVAVLI